MKYTQGNKGKIIPGFGISAVITLGMFCFIVLIPLASVLSAAVTIGPDRFRSVLTDKNVVSAFATSVTMSALAAFINAVFGTILAWVLVRYEFPGKRLIDAIVELPFAMPTAVAGITLSKMYSTTGQPGALLSRMGIYVSYTRLGILVALVFAGIPFAVRTVMPVLEKMSGVYEEAAYSLGAKPIQIFFRVILPEIIPAVLTGFSLSFARGIGEYGSIIYISGNSAKEHTQMISYIIMQKLNYMDYESAAVIGFVMLMISFAVLLVINILQSWQSKRVDGAEEAAVSFRGAYINTSGAVKGGLILISVLFITLMLILPLISVIYNAFAGGLLFYLQSISTGYVRASLFITLIAVAFAVCVNTIFGLSASWLITRFDFKGKKLLSSAIDLPFSICPVIAGLSFIMMFGRLGWAYPALQWINNTFHLNIQIVFALPGVVLATIFVTFPFVSREIIPVLNAKGKDEEEAAAMMGAGFFHIFRHVTFPHIKWACCYGMILCMARALGEFGAVSALSKTRGKTFTLPLEIDALYMSGNADSITAAFSVSSVLIAISIVILIIRNIFEYREKTRCM